MHRHNLLLAAIWLIGATGFDSPSTYRATRNGRPIFHSAPLFDSAQVPSHKLGQACVQTSECETAFSICQGGICICRDGFQTRKNRCTAATANCPFGRPSGSLINCRMSLVRNDCTGPGCTFPPVPSIGAPPRPGSGTPVVSPIQSSHWEDDCPSGSFCLTHNSFIGAAGHAQGHCCLKPQLQCPVGLPDDRYICKSYPRNQFGRQSCPSDTHTCITMQLNGIGLPTATDGICCPKPCSGDQLYANNRCYARSRPNEKCQINEQCQSSGGICSNGRCICPSGTIDKVTRCERPSCYTGFGQIRKRTSALLDLSGNVKICRQAIDCGIGAYCTLGSYCCEIPTAYCPNNPKKPVPNPRYCDPFGRRGRRCPLDLVCLQYYSSPDGGEGVCCERTRIP